MPGFYHCATGAREDPHQEAQKMDSNLLHASAAGNRVISAKVGMDFSRNLGIVVFDQCKLLFSKDYLNCLKNVTQHVILIFIVVF